MRISYLSLAALDLAEIRSYLSDNYPGLAQLVGHKLRDSLNSLAEFPNLGKLGRIAGTRELVIPKAGKITYIVVYRVVGEEIQVLRVLAGMRDIDSILEAGFQEEGI